ncbi:MAG: hypothetical protein ACYC6Y_07600 [Thermoguttaceae bacterium]
MNKQYPLITLMTVMVSTGAAAMCHGAEVYRLDMGAEDSPLRDGFTRVTAKSIYSPETGFGWRTAEGLRSHYEPYSRQWQYNESRGSEYPPTIYANEVTCDTISSDRANALLLDVPPGQYTVYLVGGLSAGSSRDYHWFDASVGRASQAVKIPGPWIFEKRVFETRVEQGPLAIELAPRTDWLVSCVVVFPSDREKQVRKDFLDALEEEIYFLPPDVAAKWQRTERLEPRQMPEFSEEDRRRGYAVFSRHWSEVIYPNTAPRPGELDPDLAIFASQGEYEPVTLTVRPLADLAGASLSAGDLRCGESVIPASRIDVRWVRYMLVRPNYSMFFSYHVAPDVLEHRPPGDLKEGENQRFWITVHVPEDAAPGVYEGKLKFEAAGRAGAEVPLKLRVLPIRLQKDPRHVYGMYYRDPLSQVSDGNSAEANAYFVRKAELERQDMVEHGMTTHISEVSGLERDEAGNWTMDGAETDRRIALSRKYRLADQPLVVSIPVSSWYGRLVDKRGTGSHLRLVGDEVPQSFYDEVTRMVEAVQKERQNYHWPEFLYYPIDEPSTSPASVAFMVGVMKAIKRVPGVRTYVTADPSHEQFEPMWPYVDVWCCQPFVFGYDRIQQLSREKGIEFWCYPNHISGENDHTPIRGARMTWGFGFWKSGFKALIPWIYQSSTGNPWNYLDGSAMDFFNRSTPDGEPIPVAMWEAYREGIDDGRYLHTLQQLVEKARKAGGPAAELARQAEREIGGLWDDIEVQEKYKYERLWSGEDFDARRWLVASWILRLQ